jgi:hypothetical protein
MLIHPKAGRRKIHGLHKGLMPADRCFAAPPRP